MKKKTFIRFVAGIPLLVLILIVIILISEPKVGGISKAAAYKAATLLLTDSENCEKLLAEQKQGYFSEDEKNNWYVKYMNYLYTNGKLFVKEVPPTAQSAQAMMTYKEAVTLAETLSPGMGKSVRVGKKKQEKMIPADEWWILYNNLRKKLDDDGQIKELDILLYGTPMNVRSAPAWTAYTDKGNFRFEGLSLDPYIDHELKLLVRGEEVIAVKEVLNDSVIYKNVWLQRGDKDTFTVHLGTIERSFPMDASLGQVEEFVDNLADLTLKNRELQKVTLKKKRITGKVLAVKDNAVEIEGYGRLQMDKDFKVYKLYGQFEEQDISSILVGYDIQEFVVAHGKLCAALTIREFDAKSIRILLMNTNFQSIFHPSVTLSAENGMKLTYGDEEVEIPAKAEVIIDSSDERLKTGRMVLTPLNKDDEIAVNSIERSLGTPFYGGSIEIRKEAEGLVLINEVYLEEYLEKVVPSEMPDSYEMEALKAQAVCARTYAYRQIQSNAYSQYGAHVDDSTRFQVYNNLKTLTKTETAVRETYGKLLFYHDEAIEAFYFATSCGHTTDGSVWGSNPSKYPYLDGCLLREDRPVLNLSTNENFAEFIKDKNYPSYDASFPMYRWETTVTNRQLEDEITAVGTILNVSVTERGVGGIVKQLRVEGSDGVTTINGEGQARANLCSPSLVITKNDGSQMTNADSLPSAYIAIENEGVDDNNVTTFHIYGGGYGHGVGMSQNGAQAMAKEGKTFEEILSLFYTDVTIQEVNEK